jgi:MoaA/NifB/PqqE/SkfB family radical SAM enzyme
MDDVFGRSILPLSGWHKLENDPDCRDSFRWIRRKAILKMAVEEPGGLLCLDILNYFPQGQSTLRIRSLAGRSIDRISPRQGRGRYVVSLSDSAGKAHIDGIEISVDCEVDPAEKAEGDCRELAMRVYEVEHYSSEDLFRKSRWLEVPRGPGVLTIETSAKCNLKCPMCRLAKTEFFTPGPEEFPESYMPKVMGLAAEAETVVLHGWGEPLLAQSFYRLLELLDCTPARVSFNTNGTILDKRLIAAIRKGSVFSINYSLDAASRETYRRIRNHDFNKTLSNIREVIQLKKRMCLSCPTVYLNMTLMRSNIGEAHLLLELARDIGADGVYFWHLCDHRWLEEDGRAWVSGEGHRRFDYQRELLKHTPELSDTRLQQALEHAEEIGVKAYTDHSRPMFFGNGASPIGGCGTSDPAAEPRSCQWPWNELFVRADGSVWFCWWQNTGYRGHPLGHLDEVEDLSEIWNGDAIRNARYATVMNRLPGQCDTVPCKYALRTPSPDREPMSISGKL